MDRRAPSVTIDGIPELTAWAEIDCRVYTSFSTFDGGPIPARDATLTVRVRYCIPGISRGDYVERRAGHADAEASVVESPPYPEKELTRRTEASGDVTFAPDKQGSWGVEVASNHDLLDRLIVCERADFPGVPMTAAYVENGVAITCGVYLVPAAYRLTTAAAEEWATIEIRYRRCPAAYAGADHAADCGEPIGNAAVGLLREGVAAGTGYTDLDGVVRFEVGAGEIAVDPAPLGEPDDRIRVTCAGVNAPMLELAYPLEIVAGDRVQCGVYLVPAA